MLHLYGLYPRFQSLILSTSNVQYSTYINTYNGHSFQRLFFHCDPDNFVLGV